MNLDAKVDNEIFRKDNPIILACNRHLATLLPVRLYYNASGYKTGRVLGRLTASGNYVNYNDAGSDGEQVARAVLFEDVPVESFESTTGTAVARGIFGGELYEDKMLGLDTNARTDLGSRSFVDASGVTIFKF